MTIECPKLLMSWLVETKKKTNCKFLHSLLPLDIYINRTHTPHSHQKNF